MLRVRLSFFGQAHAVVQQLEILSDRINGGELGAGFFRDFLVGKTELESFD